MRRRTLTLLLLPALVVAGLVGAKESPASAAPEPVSFTASGDFAATSNTRGVLDAVAASTSQLHLALGDLSYGATGQEQAWCDFVTSRVGAGFPFELLSGNHEGSGQNGNINDFSACLPNQLPGVVGTYGRQWYVDVPQQDPVARFVMISPGVPFSDGVASYAAGSPRYAWTAAAIDGARTAGVPWVVVGMHKPCLSIGAYECEAGADLTNMLAAKRVDLVLSGHEHLYQRTKQLALSGACPALTPGTYAAGCVADADADLAQGAGTVFATVGTGGTALRDVNLADSELPYFSAWSGLNADPTWGSLAVDVDGDRLSARFLRGAGGTFADAFTLTRSAAPTNQPPTAVVATPSCTQITCSFDGSASSDPDGTIASWSWSFGDGTAGTGPTPTHTYAAAGSYPVTLTVTDDDGATASAVRTATVTSGAPAPLTQDDFGRTTAAGWGTADTGGAWSVSTTAATSVGGGVGRIVNRTAGADVRAFLQGVSSSATDLRLTLAVDTPGSGTGSGLYLNVVGRRVGSSQYAGRVRLASNGALQASVMRTAGAETAISGSVSVPGGAYVAGEALNVRLSVTGTAPTTIRWKVWRAGTPEPSAWTVTVTDATAALQSAGYVGVRTYLSSSATAVPVTTSVDALRVDAATAP